MNKPDARLLNPATQDYLRQQAIRLREQGKRISEIATYLGVHRTTVSRWWSQYQQEGEVALKQQPRGAKLGEGRTLSAAQEARVQRLMPDNFPDELNIDSALWTSSAVQRLIADECGVAMPIRTVGEYLKRWGYIALSKYVRTTFEGGIDTITKAIKFIPSLPHPILQHKPPVLNLV